MSLNKWIGTGRLTRDAEVRYGGANNTAVAHCTLAVDRDYKRDGEPTADFPRLVAFGKIAEFLEKYGRKGVKFEVVGHIQTGSYQDKDGKTVYTTDIAVERMNFAESKAASQNYTGAASEPVNQPAADSDGFMSIQDGIDEQLPFN